MAGLPEDTSDGGIYESAPIQIITPQPTIYIASPQTAYEPLRQGEILSNVIQFCLNMDALKRGEYIADPIIHPLAIVLTQDCDCEQDFKSRRENKSGMTPAILFCEIDAAEEVAGSGNKSGINSSIRGRIKINKDERYHFFENAVPEVDGLGEGLPELICDFKRYFTIPTDEIYHRINAQETKRRCRLASPYLEHLAVRFGYFSQRVALPLDHASV